MEVFLFSLPPFAKYLLVFGVSCLVAYLLTKFFIRSAHCWNLLDKPDARRIHTKAIPVGGGIAVFLAFHAACALWFFLILTKEVEALGVGWWYGLLASTSLLAVIGLYDDAKGMSPYLKLLGQCTAALLMYHFSDTGFGNLLGVGIPAWLDVVLTVLWFVALVNAFNLIDGLDGLCSGLALVASLGLAALFVILRISLEALVPLALAGACLGFLRFNFHPAKVFLGDTGSMFLGFTLAAIALETQLKGTFLVAVAIPLLAAGVPIVDTLLAIWRRSIRRYVHTGQAHGGIMSADRQHLHHRLLDRGFSQRKVALVLYATGVAAVAAGLLVLLIQEKAVGFWLILFLLVTVVVIRHVAHIEMWDTGIAILRGLQKPAKPALATLLYLGWDLMVLALALRLSFLLVHNPESNGTSLSQWWQSIVIWPAPFLAALVLSQTYRRVWSKSGARDFLVLQGAIAAGFILLLAMLFLWHNNLERYEAVRAIVFGALVYVGVVSGRSIAQVVRTLLVSVLQQNFSEACKVARRALVIGANEEALVFLKSRFYGDPEKARQLKVFGLLSNDPSLRGRFIAGYPVLGQIDDLPELAVKFDINHIVLAESLNRSQRDLVLAMAKSHRIELSEWKAGRTLLWTPGKEDSCVELLSTESSHFHFDRGKKEAKPLTG